MVVGTLIWKNADEEVNLIDRLHLLKNTFCSGRSPTQSGGDADMEER